MSELSLAINNYVNMLSKDCGYDIIINDRFGLLQNNCDFTSLSALNKWHNNPYCLKIKNSHKLRRKCLYYKKNYTKIITETQKPHFFNLYCSVCEYAVPIIINNVLFCTVSVTGFKGKYSDNLIDCLSNRLDIDASSLTTLRQASLTDLKTETKQKLEAYISPLCIMLKQYYLSLENINIYFAQAKNSAKQNYVFNAMDYIDRKYYDKITVADIAKHCNISVSYLKHIFKEVNGFTINEQIIKKRTQKSTELLCTTNADIKYIAFSSGFDNPNYFCTVFKKVYGISPSEYRKKHALKSKNIVP